jgi:large subunit ribosomal protein L10
LIKTSSERNTTLPLTKEKKDVIVKELADLLATSKMTVVAKYEGTTVKAMQELRRQAEANGTSIKVVKNRLVRKALEQTESHAKSDTSDLSGMLMYAFNASDEVAPAQVLHAMAKTEKQIEFIGAYDADGNYLSAEQVKALAVLPSRDVMIATVIATLKAPVGNVTGALAGNLHGLLDAIATKNA